MIISLDYDGTFNVDKEMWLEFIRSAQNKGHKVILCTARYPTQDNTDVCSDLSGIVDIYFTGKQPKKAYLKDKNIRVDIWIDNSPQSIVNRCTQTVNVF